MDGLPFLSLACCSTLGGIDGLYFDPRERPDQRGDLGGELEWRLAMVKLLANIVLNLKAAGPAAVFATWIICITAIGLFGEGELAHRAISVLSVVGAVLAAALAMKAG